MSSRRSRPDPRNPSMRILIAAFAVATLLPAAAAPRVSQPARALVPAYDAASLTRACDDGIARAKKTIAAMAARRAPGAICDEWNRLAIAVEDFGSVAYLLGSVSPDKAVRDAAEPCLQKYTALQTEIFQDEGLLRRVKAAAPMNPHQAKLQKDLLEEFEDSGA